MYMKYEHYGNEVWVRQDLKGKHREHCLCWSCNKFKPNEEHAPGTNLSGENCPIANKVFDICRTEGLVLPVWECPKFDAVGGYE